MLQTLVSGCEKIAIHACRRVSLLDQLKLHITRIGQRDGEMNIVVALLLVPEAVKRQFLGDEPRSDSTDLDPVTRGLFNVADDKAHLPQRTKQTTHHRSSRLMPKRCLRLTPPRREIE